MKEKAKLKLILFGLIIFIIAVDYPFIDKSLTSLLSDYEVGYAERVVDGDTIIVNGSSVRLLGINTPEKGEKYYLEAKEFLENLTAGKMLKLKKSRDDVDMYGRKLRYIFVDGENVNLEIVKGGYGNYYFPSGKDRYSPEIKEAWEECLKNGKNLCKPSEDKCASCIRLKKLDVKNQEVVLGNSCDFSCSLEGWSIKDEGRKKYVFEDFKLEKEVLIIVGNETDIKNELFWKEEEYVWTSTGDTLFLRDQEDRLVLWWGY